MANRNQSAIKMKDAVIPKQRGELARLRVIKGPDRGCAFIIVNTRASIGRGEENDMVIGDLKASRLHAEVSASPTGWVVRDLGSANGILHNGIQTRSSPIRTSDLITLGETVLEFLGAEVEPQRLLSPPIDDVQAEFLVQAKATARDRPRTLSDPFGLNSRPTAAATAGAGSKKVVRLTIAGVLAVVVVIGMEMFSEDAAPRPKKSSRKVASTGEPVDLASLMPRLEKPQTSRNAEMFFKQGFREYRERNYIRALSQFELVLQMDPEHDMARRYRDNARMAIEDEVKTHLEFGKKTFASGKLREARGHYEAILRLLHTDQANPSYTEAKEQLEKVRSEMDGG
jgi:pSer/pThr/pTyr-binding forkhead associated (FHA) protein